MTMGPEPMSRILWMSERRGMVSQVPFVASWPAGAQDTSAAQAVAARRARVSGWPHRADRHHFREEGATRRSESNRSCPDVPAWAAPVRRHLDAASEKIA